MNFDTVWDLSRMAGVGLIAGLFSALLGSKDHRFRKWWEMRVAAYQTVIEALSDLTTAHEVRLRAELNGNGLSEARELELAELGAIAFTRVRKAADAGAFLFSEEANIALEAVKLEWEKEHNTYVERLDEMQFAAKKCLKTLVNLSKEDLRLDRHMFIWR
jgi:hypothetical protein